jgi:hypothetical protein
MRNDGVGRRSRVNRLRGRVVVSAIVAALLLAAGVATTGATTFKPFSVVMTASAGANGLSVTAVITNENTTQQLGSANVTPPSGTPPPTPPSGYSLSGTGSTSVGTFTVVGNVVELRGLNLAPGASVTVTIGVASSPCTASAWSVEAKQSNDFSGLPGNDLTLDTANSNLVTTLCGAPCPKNASCSTDTSTSNGNDAKVVAPKSTLTGSLFESADNSTSNLDNCDGQGGPNPPGSTFRTEDPNTYHVFATVDRSKVVTITINKATIALADQQVCFQAPYKTLSDGTPIGTATGAPPVVDPITGLFTWWLQDCSKTSVGPCHNRSQDAPTASGGVTLVVDIPSGLPGDPNTR